jgi:hypothetical protein
LGGHDQFLVERQSDGDPRLEQSPTNNMKKNTDKSQNCTDTFLGVAIRALFGIFILRGASMLEKLTGRERFFSVWVTIKEASGRIEQVQKSTTATAILRAMKEPKGIFAGVEYREWEILNIRTAIWEI